MENVDVSLARTERKETLRQKLLQSEIIHMPDGFVTPLNSEVERIVQVVSEWLWSE
jgi:hypothetical protein